MGGGDIAKAAGELAKYLKRVWRTKKQLKMRGYDMELYLASCERGSEVNPPESALNCLARKHVPEEFKCDRSSFFPPANFE